MGQDSGGVNVSQCSKGTFDTVGNNFTLSTGWERQLVITTFTHWTPIMLQYLSIKRSDRRAQ